MSDLDIYSQSLGQGQSLVLLHGWGVNSGVWDSLITELSAKYRVTVIDLPGFGRSHKAMLKEYTLNSVSKAIAHLIPPDSILLGWSLGGLIANNIALERLASISALVTVASSPKFVSGDQWRGIQPDILQMFQQQLQADFLKTLERFIAIQAMGSASAALDIRSLVKAIGQHPIPAKEALIAGLSLLETVDLRSQLSQIKVPVLCAYGKLDTLVPKKSHSTIKNLYSNSEMYVFEQASHAPFISHPQEFISMLSRFIGSLSSLGNSDEE
ncbi:pimeloyl-ACP methyl ester esterase BioH [Alteromonadaceae bacterium BrNp21-10]|nr:pimeloyl-ACP methyl ester esterase BioH [Alteromonadaceae bacterium BrNp21-10]